MNASFKLFAPLVAALAIAACNAGGSSNIPTSAGASQTAASIAANQFVDRYAQHRDQRFCPQVVGRATCMAIVPKGVRPLCGPTTCGLSPQELESAYNLSPSLGKGTGTIVAVIEAGDDPDAASTLATYRSAFNLSTGTMYKYNQSGKQSNYPESCEDFGWCVETDLDIEMVSASCPNCTIALMEANTDSAADLATTTATAVSIGATIISSSWACYGSWNATACGATSSFPNYYDSPGIAYLASSGDAGYGEIGGPSDLDTVIAVGGTQLRKEGSKWYEEVWDDQYGAAGAGCSNTATVGANVPKPSWQHDPDCAERTDADVSAQAGLEPGVSMYSGIYGEWLEIGGTSVASPFTAGVIALAGNASSQNGGEKFWKLSNKKHKREFRVISEGADGSCGNEYLCKAGAPKGLKYKTYSGPAGWGTPNGIAAY